MCAGWRKPAAGRFETKAFGSGAPCPSALHCTGVLGTRVKVITSGWFSENGKPQSIGSIDAAMFDTAPLPMPNCTEKSTLGVLMASRWPPSQ